MLISFRVWDTRNELIFDGGSSNSHYFFRSNLEDADLSGIVVLFWRNQGKEPFSATVEGGGELMRTFAAQKAKSVASKELQARRIRAKMTAVSQINIQLRITQKAEEKGGHTPW